jgi:hypothetical protein
MRWTCHALWQVLSLAVCMQEFKAGKSPIMLATDVAARGLGMR